MLRYNKTSSKLRESAAMNESVELSGDDFMDLIGFDEASEILDWDS